jgi:hypothetical protein
MATELANSVELCPECGAIPRWIGSTPDTDCSQCPCGNEFEVHIGRG